MRSLSLLWFSKQKGMHPWKSIDKDNKKGAQMGPVSARHPRKKLLIGKEKCMPPNQNWQFFRGTGTILIIFHSLIEIVMKFSRHKRLLIRKWHEMRHDNINAKHHPSHPTFSWFFRDGVVHFGNHPATGGIPLWHFLGPFQHGLCLCWASTKQSSSQPRKKQQQCKRLKTKTSGILELLALHLYLYEYIWIMNVNGQKYGCSQQPYHDIHGCSPMHLLIQHHEYVPPVRKCWTCAQWWGSNTASTNE